MKVGYKKSALGEIPVDWEVVRIGDVLNNIKGGGTPSKDIPEYWKSEIPWATVKDLKKLILNDTIDYISKIGLENSASNLIPAWTLIISTRMAVGKAVFVTKDVSINQDLKALFPKDNLDKFFLFHWFFFNSDNILNLASGSTVKGIRLEVLKGLTFALPPLKEQQKIAEILSTVDAKISIIDEQISETQNLKKGLMQSLLSKGIGHTEFKKSALGEIPKSWEVVKSSEIFELIHGYQFRDYDFTEKGLPIIKIGQINRIGQIDMSNCSFFSDNRAEEFVSKRIFNGDVLMALTGATLGKSCLVEGLDFPIYQNYRVGKFEPHESSKLSKKYLYYLIGSLLVLNQIFSKINSGAQGNIGKSDFEKLKIPFPPLKEQQKIASILSSVDEKLGVLSEKKSYYQELKKGLMQQLLTGLVRVLV